MPTWFSTGTMTDRRAAEAVRLNPDTAAYTKAKPRVRAYMLEHRAAVHEQLVQQETEELRRLNQSREQVLARLWEIANLDPEMTRNSASAQIKALSMIVKGHRRPPVFEVRSRRLTSESRTIRPLALLGHGSLAFPSRVSQAPGIGGLLLWRRWARVQEPNRRREIGRATLQFAEVSTLTDRRIGNAEARFVSRQSRGREVSCSSEARRRPVRRIFIEETARRQRSDHSIGDRITAYSSAEFSPHCLLPPAAAVCVIPATLRQAGS